MIPRSRSIVGELERMRREMDRIWDRFSKGSPSTFQQEWHPSLNLSETEDTLVAEIEVPGINPEDIDISVTSEMITIAGEKKQAKEDEQKNYHLMERSYGQFSRSLQLPSVIDPERVEARYRDGILLITLGKTGPTKSKRIEVKAT